MKKLLCPLLVVVVAFFGWTPLVFPADARRPKDYSVKGVVQAVFEQVSPKVSSVKDGGIVIEGIRIVVPSISTGPNSWPVRITRSGRKATMKEVAVGDDVVLEYHYNLSLSAHPPQWVAILIAAQFTPGTSAKAPITKDEAAKTKATANAATLKFYQERADKGDAYGQYRVGMLYLKGDGVPEDKDKARDYLSKAAAQGNQDAATELAKLSAPEPPPQTNSTPKKGEDR